MNNPTTEAGLEVVAWQDGDWAQVEKAADECSETGNWIPLVRKSDADAREEATRAEMDRLQEIGAFMANAMFNLAQRTGHVLTAAECASFKELQVKWDAARSGLAATSVATKKD